MDLSLFQNIPLEIVAKSPPYEFMSYAFVFSLRLIINHRSHADWIFDKIKPDEL